MFRIRSVSRGLMLGLTAVAALGLTNIAIGSGTAPATGQAHDHDHDDHAMHAEMGKPAPDFTLTDTEGNEHTLSQYTKEGYTVVLEWFNPDCPFVKKHHVTFGSMAKTQSAFEKEKVVWLAVNSGGEGKQGNGLERNQKAIEEYGMDYPVLLDENGEVGKMYGAKTTPQMYVIHDGVLVFDGPLDDVGDHKTLGEKNYIMEVVGACCDGKDVDPAQVKSYGCSVKYAS